MAMGGEANRQVAESFWNALAARDFFGSTSEAADWRKDLVERV